MEETLKAKAGLFESVTRFERAIALVVAGARGGATNSNIEEGNQ